MSPTSHHAKTKIPEIVKRHEQDLLTEWVRLQVASATQRPDLMRESELKKQSSDFLRLFIDAAHSGNTTDMTGPEWKGVRDLLTEISRSRSIQGFTPTETATFVFSFKQPLFSRLRREFEANPAALADELWTGTQIIDKLGLFTTEIHQKTREQVINRQQQELLELSTPVVKMWDGILVLPMIGTLDSSRTQVVMENLLQKIVETGSAIAIIDITGVPTVDTLVAQHLLKTVTAARLMGAECIISGIRPQIAATIVHLGVDLGNITTKASLADAFSVALVRLGSSIARGLNQKNAAAPMARGA